MDKVSAIHLLKKYKDISHILGLKKDEELLNELINMVDKNIDSFKKEKIVKKSQYGETDFLQLIQKQLMDISKYKLSDSIISNRDNILIFWGSLTEENKSIYTIFELNVILYLISPQYNKYQKKDKRTLIRFINYAVREKKQVESYKTIKV